MAFFSPVAYTAVAGPGLTLGCCNDRLSDTWNLKFSHFAKIKIKIPCIQEQRGIAEVLEKADQQIEVIQRQLSALREEKAALMSQLLTGKRRVMLPDAEAEVQA